LLLAELLTEKTSNNRYTINQHYQPT